ncbi:MAG: 3-oxoacyl-ACP reductase FabG [Clostridiaceae bacterium]|jgi:3-oxoacyl-[acyl-carrier protein] reductase|nr:3-oxoacyl-ACP reductase FabG [Clostridiaceae bacterium]
MKTRRHALITGSSRGIGAETARLFARNGYAVSVIYRKNSYLADQVVSDIRRLGGEAVSYRVDLVDFHAVKSVASQAMLEFGAVDVLVSNAGISNFGLFQDVTPEAFRETIDTHITGLFNVTQAILPGMLSRKVGSIVTVSSIWGMTGASCEVAYSTAKAGIVGFTKALAKEVGPSGIRVNCVAPGLIDTDMNSRLSVKEIQDICDETPLGRIGSAAEVAEAIYFLASDQADFITGQVLSPNGGLLI